MTHKITDEALKAMVTRAFEQGYDSGYIIGRGITLSERENDTKKFNVPEPSDLSFNCWRPISEYDESKYDWVLVRQADVYDKFVPTVAERRKDGKWYNQNDDQLPSMYDVVEFFDMSLLDKKKGDLE